MLYIQTSFYQLVSGTLRKYVYFDVDVLISYPFQFNNGIS